MSEPGAIAPKPYAFCDEHFVANCPICMRGVQPTPVSGEPIRVPEAAKLPAQAPEPAISAPVAPPKPVFVDPKAQAVSEAAARFAAAREAVAMIQEQLQAQLAGLDALRAKEAQALEEQAQALLVMSEAIEGVNAKF